MKTTPRVLAAAWLLTLAANSLATTPYHDFLLADGRSFRGRIVVYDQHSDVVTIERADKKLVKTSSAVFDEADQLRIKEWHLIKCFGSEKQLKISAARICFKGGKVEHPGFFGSGPVTKQMRHMRYTIDLENCSGLAFRNLTVEYRIYYSQEYQKPPGQKWIKKEGIKCGSEFIACLAPKTKSEVETADIIMNKIEDLRYIVPPSSFKKSKKVDVVGIWVRISRSLSNDRKVMREYCLPDNLGKHHKWVEIDVPVGLNE